MKKRTRYVIMALMICCVACLWSCTKIDPPQVSDATSTEIKELGMSEASVKRIKDEHDKGYNADSPQVNIQSTNYLK